MNHNQIVILYDGGNVVKGIIVEINGVVKPKHYHVTRRKVNQLFRSIRSDGYLPADTKIILRKIGPRMEERTDTLLDDKILKEFNLI